MIFQISPQIAVRPDYEEVFTFLSDNILNTFVAYVLNSNYRKAVQLTPWIKEQINNPTQEVLEIASKINIPDKTDYDSIAIQTLRYVQTRLTYKGDIATRKTPEYWQTAHETVTTWEGDCEDGAILIYTLCRLNGVPANRLFLFAMDVKGGGHAVLGYKPQLYPLNFAFLDWCYWYSNKPITQRALFYIADKTIYEHRYNGESHNSTGIKGNYINLWFAFNEDKSYLSFKTKYQENNL